MIGGVGAEFFERAVGPVFAMGLFALVAIEAIAPRRVQRTDRLAHAGRNLIWVAAALAVNAVVASVLVTGATEYAARHRWGLLPLLGLDGIAAVILGLVLLELTGYPLHVLKRCWRSSRCP
jgi:hypothetical protein